MIITNSYTCDLMVVIFTLILTLVIYIKHKYNFWKNKGIPQLKPTFPFGDYEKEFPRGIGIGAITKRYYDAFKKIGCKLGGIYFGLDPYLVIVDPTYAKDILTNDFKYFVDRVLYMSKKDPFSINILSQRGDEWKHSRNKFTQMFTAAKLKQFFNKMQECSEDLKKTLKKYGNGDLDLDIFEVFACYTTDIVGSFVFGIDANSFKSSDAIFRKAGRDVFSKFSPLDRVRLFLTICYPNLCKKLGVSNIQPDIQKFYTNFMEEVLEYRKENKIYRQDFLQVLTEMKESGINLTLEQMSAQAFLFVTAGFETSSGSATFLLYELGLHQDLQDRAREEINQVLKKHNDELTYEAISQLTYLRQIFDESARKYPQATTLSRMCVKDYTFKDSDITIKKGTPVLLPVLGYHYDSSYYIDPLKFDPERFAEKSDKHEGYFPFGDGPRNCMGARFGLMQVIMGVVTILRDYKVFVSPRTEEPLEFDELTFVTKMKQTVYLKLKEITKTR